LGEAKSHSLVGVGESSISMRWGMENHETDLMETNEF
jgi:hypothetical protein